MKVELLKERILTWEGSGELLNLYDAFSALTLGKPCDAFFASVTGTLTYLRGHHRVCLRELHTSAPKS